jgi:flagellar FliL protein
MADEKEEKLEDKKTEGEEGAEGADGAEGAAEGDGAGKKKKLSKKKLIIIIVGLLVLLIGGAAGAYFGGFIGGGEHSDSGGNSEKTEAKKTYLDLPDFLVNLNTSSRSSSFLKMTIVLDLADEKDKATIDANMPRILDSFNAYLRELRPSDLYGSAGLYRLREELLARVNKIVAPAQVNDILFKQILIQ